MKVRQKIALIFTTITSIVLLFSFSFIYYLAANYTERDFYSRVEEKATLTAWKYFEEDELSKPAYKLVIERYIQSLPEAREVILNADSFSTRDSLKKLLPNRLVQRLLSRNMIKFRKDDRQGVGLYYPDNQGNFIIIVTAIDKYGIQKQHNLMEVLISIFLGGLVFVYLVGQFYAKRVLSPVVTIMKNVRKINATNLSLRLREKSGNDELTELTRMFNQMLERLEDSFTMQKNFIHNASHELKNPITAILGETEVALKRQRSTEEYVATLQVIMGETERLEKLTRNLLALAQADFDMSSMTFEQIRIDKLIVEIKESLNKSVYKNRIVVALDKPSIDNNYCITGIYSLIYIAIANIADNACKFSNGQVDITLSEANGIILVRISDKGIGIPEADIQNLFQPFFRGSNALLYKGSGIGLSLVKKIIDLHRGTVSFSSKTTLGTTVEVTLPQILIRMNI
ncbi:MAG TPA: ATP-binding protein [Bacteroidales bacterium]